MLIKEEVQSICADLKRVEVIDRFLVSFISLNVKNFVSFLVLFGFFCFFVFGV